MLNGNEEPAVLFRHVPDDGFDQVLARLYELSESDRSCCHAIEASGEFRRNVEARRGKYLRHWPVVAEKVDQEGLAQFVAYALVCEQVPHVE